MRDNRLTILLTEDERATVDELARRAGVSSSGFMRDLVEEFENLSPDEEAELKALLAQVNEVLPSMHASLDRMSERMAEISASVHGLREQLSTTDQRLAKIEQSIERGALTQLQDSQ